MKDILLFCPQCGHKSLEDLGDTFECPICHEEYDKEDLISGEGDAHNLLSVREKTNFTDILKDILKE